jgi:hypothetical protein
MVHKLPGLPLHVGLDRTSGQRVPRVIVTTTARLDAKAKRQAEYLAHVAEAQRSPTTPEQDLGGGWCGSGDVYE